jgi:hypothetical protein
VANTYISLAIQNNTSATIPISIMGNPSNLADVSNQTREFRWNLTSFSFSGENQVSIDYRPNALADFTTYNAPLLVQSIQGVLDAINGLGIGSFFTFDSGGNTYISNYNNDYVFGELNIWDSNTTQVTWSVDCVGTTGNNDITSGMFADSQANPYTAISNVPIASNGQQVDISGTTSNQPSTKVKIYNQTTSTYIVNAGLGSGVVYNYSFNAYYGNTYLITIQDY